MNHFELLLREMNTILFVLFSMFFLIFIFSIVYCSRHQKVQQSHIDQSHRSIHLFYSPMDKHTQYKEVMSQPRRFVWFSFFHCIWWSMELCSNFFHSITGIISLFLNLDKVQTILFLFCSFIRYRKIYICITVKKQNDSNC